MAAPVFLTEFPLAGIIKLWFADVRVQEQKLPHSTLILRNADFEEVSTAHGGSRLLLITGWHCDDVHCNKNWYDADGTGMPFFVDTPISYTWSHRSRAGTKLSLALDESARVSQGLFDL